MSSLMQFTGRIRPGRVGLEFYLTKKTYPLPSLPGYYQDEPVELVECVQCGKKHQQLYRIWRKPAGMCGCWVVFRINGQERVPDLSCPFGLEDKPLDAEKLSAEENAAAWHRS